MVIYSETCLNQTFLGPVYMFNLMKIYTGFQFIYSGFTVYIKFLKQIPLQELRLDGTIKVNGVAGTSTHHAGGGSGGSLSMILGSLKGHGTASSNGGTGPSGTFFFIYKY